MNLGFPTNGFFADNGGEFANVKLDELTSKLGLIVSMDQLFHHGVMTLMRGTMLLRMSPSRN